MRGVFSISPAPKSENRVLPSASNEQEELSAHRLGVSAFVRGARTDELPDYQQAHEGEVAPVGAGVKRYGEHPPQHGDDGADEEPMLEKDGRESQVHDDDHPARKRDETSDIHE